MLGHRSVNILLQGYLRWNRRAQRALWLLVCIGLIAAAPLAWARADVEDSSKRVEIVFDYLDLVNLAEFSANPEQFIADELDNLKEAGITTLAVYESTLLEMQQSRRLQFYTSREMAALSDQASLGEENYTYVVFADSYYQEILQPKIVDAFERIEIPVREASFFGRPALVIGMPAAEAKFVAMAPDTITLSQLSQQGFALAVRLSDALNYSPEEMDRLVQDLKGYGATSFVFAGSAVTGFASEADNGMLTYMSELMKKYDITFAVIETDPSKPSQKGMQKLAYLLDYEVVRLHSIQEEQMFNSPETLSNRMVLAVKDRNIRMIYLNAHSTRDADTNQIKLSLQNMYTSLKGEDGAIQRIQEEGFEIGRAEPFEANEAGWAKPLKLVVLIGAIAFIALLIGAFFPLLTSVAFAIGLIGSAGLYVLNSKLLLQAAALGVSISAPTLAVIFAMHRLSRHSKDERGFWASAAGAVWTLLRSAAISASGILFVVGLLQSITFMLAIDVFRGVSLLKLAPIGLIVIYYVLFKDRLPAEKLAVRLKELLMANVKVVYVVAVGLAGVIGLYYLSRAGNTGQTLPFEQQFRAFLETSLGVRPRTQEFLIGHPLLLLGSYLMLRYGKGLYVAAAGIIGQLTMVNTFSHIHTPLAISGLRVFYGIAFGILVGLVLILAFEVLIRSWRKWQSWIRLAERS